LRFFPTPAPYHVLEHTFHLDLAQSPKQTLKTHMHITHVHTVWYALKHTQSLQACSHHATCVVSSSNQEAFVSCSVAQAAFTQWAIIFLIGLEIVAWLLKHALAADGSRVLNSRRFSSAANGPDGRA